MLDFLRDQIWQFVGAFFGLMAIGISIALYILQRRRKALTYRIISCTSLISEPEEVEGNLQVIFGGQPVRDVHLLLVNITNSGNQPIESTHYERPLTLSVDSPARIMTAQVVKTNPASLSAELLPDKNGKWHSQLLPELALDTHLRTIPLRHALLNAGDSFTIKMLVSEFAPGRFHLGGRVVGVKDIKETKTRPWVREMIFALFGLAAGMTVNGVTSGEPAIRYLSIIGLVFLAAFIIYDLWNTAKGIVKTP